MMTVSRRSMARNRRTSGVGIIKTKTTSGNRGRSTGTRRWAMAPNGRFSNRDSSVVMPGFDAALG